MALLTSSKATDNIISMVCYPTYLLPMTELTTGSHSGAGFVSEHWKLAWAFLSECSPSSAPPDTKISMHPVHPVFFRWAGGWADCCKRASGENKRSKTAKWNSFRRFEKLMSPFALDGQEIVFYSKVKQAMSILSIVSTSDTPNMNWLLVLLSMRTLHIL